MVVNTKNKAIFKKTLGLVKKILKIASKSRNIAYLNK
jgi:hypothetical protein